MESRLVLYTDDILLFHPIRTIGDYSALQADINALSNWATQNTMTFNTAKFKNLWEKEVFYLSSIFLSKWMPT